MLTESDHLLNSHGRAMSGVTAISNLQMRKVGHFDINHLPEFPQLGSDKPEVKPRSV